MVSDFICNKTFCKEKYLVLDPNSWFQGPCSDHDPGRLSQTPLYKSDEANAKVAFQWLGAQAAWRRTETGLTRTGVLWLWWAEETASQGLGASWAEHLTPQMRKSKPRTAPLGSSKTLWGLNLLSLNTKLNPWGGSHIPCLYEQNKVWFHLLALSQAGKVELYRKKAASIWILYCHHANYSLETSSCKWGIEAHLKPHVQIPGIFKEKQKKKIIQRSQPLLYFHKKLKQPLASCLASPPFLFGSFCYICSLKVSRLSPPVAGEKSKPVRNSLFGELKMAKMWVATVTLTVL